MVDHMSTVHCSPLSSMIHQLKKTYISICQLERQYTIVSAYLFLKSSNTFIYIIMATIIAPSPVPLLGKLEPSCAQKQRYALSDLISDIKRHLGSSSGISSSDVDEEYLKELLHRYQSNCDDWLPFYYNDKSKAYTRNAIENINQKANIVRFLAEGQLDH